MPGVDWNGSGRRGGIFLFIAAFVVVVDQISKLWVRSHLLPGESFPEVGFLRLTYVQNTGSAFGLFANQAFLLSLIAIVGLVVILLFYRYLSESNILGNLALGLVFGGAVGNLIDRLRLGYVTDFIDVRLWHDFHWPAFNVADSAITVGTIALACFIFLALKKENGHPSGARS
ncbi:MAG TPA: signal peptidase II [Dehalococcoidia bacterium]|nr:signal peptidase II [Dehalococcoidia bacterium]